MPTRSKETSDHAVEMPTASGPAGRGLRLGRIAGVEIRADWSLLIVFALIAANLGAGLFAAWHPGWSPATTWLAGLGAAVLFFASVLAHELAHAIVARAYGIPVDRITLFLFGGMAHMRAQPPSPKAELLMAIVGPITSVLIGVGRAGRRWSAHARGRAGRDRRRRCGARRHAGGDGAGRDPAAVAGPGQHHLGLFNIVPGFPLDGGRVLRALLWRATGDIVKATRWASRAGQLVAWVLIAWGALPSFGGSPGVDRLAR